MTEPSETDIRAALRLGWSLAEVKGRNRPDPPGGVATSTRPADLLPLRIERSNTESRIEAQAVLHALAGALEIDKVREVDSMSAKIDTRAKELHKFREEHNDAGTISHWELLQEDLYKFDAHIQDRLASQSELLACAYQLGRGLAESYWASQPSSKDPTPEQVESWTTLLGPERCDELARLVGRVATAFPDHTPSAIAGSLAIWKEVVETDGWWQQELTRERLGEQLRRWYELLVLGQDPTSLVRPFALLRSFRTTRKAIRLFFPQLVFLAASVLLLVGFGMASGTGTGKALIGTVGILGVTLTGVQGWIKNAAQSIVKRFRQDAYGDLIAVEITVIPERKPDQRAFHPISDPTNRALTSALAARTLTTPDAAAA